MLKVAILGPESTGKTMLARQLADYFKAPWIPEYAREYVENLTVPYTYDDVCLIAREQIKEEQDADSLASTAKYVFFDTELIITKVWFSYRFGLVPDFLTEQLNSGYFDLYLLCSPDLPWEPDPVREHGTDREFFFNWYKKEIEQTGKPYVIITGAGDQRFQNALNALKTLGKRI
ncbi:MAG: ATP-binding protein [Bacteroidota bacterium]|nr:ATP-binding protein [Bacteroidota bacterium]